MKIKATSEEIVIDYVADIMQIINDIGWTPGAAMEMVDMDEIKIF